MLVSMLVGLLILTFGATSASLFGFDFGFPIVDVEDVEGGEPCRNLCICRPAGAVVPGGSSWHLLCLGCFLLCLWCSLVLWSRVLLHCRYLHLLYVLLPDSYLCVFLMG